MKNIFIKLLMVLTIMSLSTIFLPEKIDRLLLTIEKRNLSLCLKEYAQVKKENSIQTCNNALCNIDFTSKIVFEKQNECLLLSEKYDSNIVKYIYNYNKDYVPYGIYP